MTLVVAFAAGDKIVAAADSRISRGDTTATDAGAKLFIIPIVVRSRDDEQLIPSLTHTVGFAFAGSTLIATNVQSIASAITQELYSDSTLLIPSMNSIAKLYAKVAEYVMRDMNGRLQPNEQQFVHLLIFGGCKIQNKLVAYLIKPEISEQDFHMRIDEYFPTPGHVYAIGSGAPAFHAKGQELISKGQTPSPIFLFRKILESGMVDGVGGYTQMVEAGLAGAVVCPILEQSKDNPDLVALTFLGFDTSAYGNIDGLFIGKHARGFDGVEKVGKRASRRARGLDPDDPNIPIQFDNLVKFEQSIGYARTVGYTVRLDGIIEIDSFVPQPNERCLMAACSGCGKNIPLCRDMSWVEGTEIPLHRDGGLRVKCPNCHVSAIIHPEKIRSFTWCIRLMKFSTLDLKTFVVAMAGICYDCYGKNCHRLQEA